MFCAKGVDGVLTHATFPTVIVLPIQGDRVLLPSPSYCAGIGQVTLDFPGGRVTEGQNPQQAAIATLKLE